MARHTKEQLDDWLKEFRATREGGALIEVLIEDGFDEDENSVLVVPLRDADTVVYLQPTDRQAARWIVLFEPQPNMIELTPPELLGLAAELAVAGSLAQFFHEKSLTEDSPQR